MSISLVFIMGVPPRNTSDLRVTIPLDPKQPKFMAYRKKRISCYLKLYRRELSFKIYERKLRKSITGKVDVGETFSDSLEAKVFIILYKIIQSQKKISTTIISIYKNKLNYSKLHKMK